MDDICSICLCKDRKLSSIQETDLYQSYLQILYEISVYDLSSSPLCVRICWECCAVLRKIQRFKAQVKQSYWQLVLHVNQNTGSHVLKESISRPSRLQIHHVINMSYPLIEIKNEFEVDTINGTTLPIDNLKSESIDNEPHEEPQTFVNNLSIDNGSYPQDFINNLCIDNETHREPETFVNNLEVGKPRTKKKDKLSKRKPSKDKLKKKLKVKKKRKSISEDTISDQVSNGFSDIESTLDLQVAKETETAAKEIENDKQTAFSCKQCGKCFGDEIQLSKHTDEEHTKVKDKKNGEVIKTKRKPKQEVLSEKPECVECGKVFSSRKTYRYHLEVLHKGHNRYPCPRCGKVYQWKSNLGRHMRSHTARDSGELYCETCDKRFASVATFRQHLQVSRRHVSESEFTFMCNECGKKFVNKTRLRDHIDWEHLKKIKFKCQLCNKAFKCHTSLYVHLQNVHRDKEKKDNLCHVCGKSYQNAAKLKYHIVAMHTGETPYQCQRCSAAFGWYSSLYRHVREVHYKMRQRMESKSTKKTKKQSDQLAPLLPPDMALDNLQQPGPAR